MMRARGLLGRIALSFFLLAALVVVLLTVLAYAAIVGGTRKAVLDQLDTVARAKERDLVSWFLESRRKVTNAARGVTLIEAAARARGVPEGRPALGEALRDVRASWPELGELLVAADPGGLVVASTSPEVEGEYRIRDTWFIHGRVGTYVQSVYPSPVTLRPTLTIATPLLDPTGVSLGVLAANLDLQVLDAIAGEAVAVFPSSESYLVDRFNSLVSSEQFGSDDYPRGVHSEGVDAAIRGVNTSGIQRSYRGEQVAGVYRWIDELGLSLVVEVPTAEAFLEARMQTALIAGTGMLVVAVVALGVLLLARRIVRPILDVETAARRVAAGDLDSTAAVSTRDEIGDLARSFNEMTGRLKSLYETLERDRARFRSLIEASSDAVMVLDRDARLTFASPAFRSLTGLDPSESLGTSLLDLAHPDDREAIRHALLCALVDGGVGDVRSIECRMRHREAGWITVEAAARNLQGQRGIDGLLVSARDITRRRRLEEDLAQAQKMEAVGRLAGGIAHDFNNILTAIMGYAELLASQPEMSAEARQDVAEISVAARRAAELTQQLLAYSRKQMLKPRVLDLNDLIRRTENLLRRLIGEHVDIVTDLAPDVRPVEADPSQLETVVVNLAVNSRDAMPDGGTLTVRTGNLPVAPSAQWPEAGLPPGDYVCLEVSDTGVGMDEATQKRLFEPFFTTKEFGKGTGLGLATVYGIVRQSGGQVSVRSQPGAGTTVTVLLPAGGSVVAAAPEAETDAGVRGNEAVLLVEDEEAVRRLMHETLRRAGYRVRSAVTAAEALALLDEGDGVDILVTDVVMPGMSGRRLADLVLQRRPGMRVLFVSGYTDDQALQGGRNATSSLHLSKPFSPAALAAKVREVLDGGVS